MPKKAGRGQKYTTGIKKTPSGGYGGQTTGRVPFCGWIVYLPIAISAAAGIAKATQHL